MISICTHIPSVFLFSSFGYFRAWSCVFSRPGRLEATPCSTADFTVRPQPECCLAQGPNLRFLTQCHNLAVADLLSYSPSFFSICCLQAWRRVIKNTLRNDLFHRGFHGTHSLPPPRYRAKMAHLRQSRTYSGLGFQVLRYDSPL